MIDHSYPTWLEVNLSAIEQNSRNVVQRTGVPLMAVVKANAYGHGSVEVSKAALAGGATWLGVARFGEARVLRQAGITAPILVLGMITPPEVDEAIAANVSVTLHSREVADMLSQRGKAVGKPVLAHLKIDTGIGRLGVQPGEVLELARYALSQGNIQIEGLFSHFAMADVEDHPLTAVQVSRFKGAVEALEQAGLLPRWVHLSNTAGTLVHPEARFTMVRAGSAVVGIWPFDHTPYPEYLRPALSWKARLASCKILPKGWGVGYGQEYILQQDEIIGVVPVGYGDGFRRQPGNEVLIDGRCVPVVGRVCMDQSMIRLPKAYPMGTEIVLLGKQGDAEISLDDLGKRWKTATVDVTAIINFRVPRIYVRD
ncbi:MAG: alanine racemase [Chloroflexi bacterium]|nr:alanine racemase [Chloroflexota bacterium]